MLKKQITKLRRIRRIRKKVRGNELRHRLSVRKTNKHLHIQIINDEQGVTVVSASTFAKENKMKKSKETGRILGEQIAKLALEKNIQKVVFDRGPSKYHGVLAELADSARKAGLQF